MISRDAIYANLERKALLVDSEHFRDLTYAIDRRGRGLYLLLTDGKEVAICDPAAFAKELLEVWDMHRGCGA